MLASTLDETPEGRSIVRLAARPASPVRRLEQGTFKVMPFTAERKMSGIVLADGTELFKGSIQAMEAYGAILAGALRRPQRKRRAKGMTPLAISVNKRTVGLVFLKDVVKPGIRDRIHELRLMGIHTIMCTGDNRLTAAAIAQESGVDEFVAEAKPETKLTIIEREKAEGRLVAMSGDGTNDAPALARADVGLAMNNGTSAAKEAGNMVDLDNDPTKLIEIVSIGKQLLITRGALTTFSITNDVAKYFAIIPAIFVASGAVALPGVTILNVLGLTNPYARGPRHAPVQRPDHPAAHSARPRRSSVPPPSARSTFSAGTSLYYGFGGLVSAFVGIKLIYLLLAWLSGLGWVQGMGVAVSHYLPLGFL